MIPAFLISCCAIAGFGGVLWYSAILTVARQTVSVAMAGLNAMLDNALDDDAKEVAVRRAGFALFGAAFGIAWRFALALAAAYLPLVLADFAGLATVDDVLALMLRLDYIVIVSLVLVVASAAFKRWRAGGAAAEEGTPQQGTLYSPVDRFFHLLAFSKPFVLKKASRIEDVFVRVPATEAARQPVFVTSLARGGTTAVLNALHDLPDVATHTYRDMPFLTAPVIWKKLSGRKRSVARRQRAHGDGLAIDLDSPEAFEEVLWKLFWPGKFASDRIALWNSQDRRVDADRFLKRHMTKIIRARGKPAETGRYCSKNNANIARIDYLTEVFPEGRIVVPLRRPECHAASLLRQHRNFLALQSEDDFVQRYMQDIGHFEFGHIHKPLAFAGFDPAGFDPDSGDYWLAYWIAAFEDVLTHKQACLIVTQDDLRSAPVPTMEKLCAELGLRTEGIDFKSYFRSSEDRADASLFDPDLLARAQALYAALRAGTAAA